MKKIDKILNFILGLAFKEAALWIGIRHFARNAEKMSNTW